MNLVINGEPQSVAVNALTITELLELFKVEMPDMVSVQLNGNFVERHLFPTNLVKENDEIDFLYFMGGGR